MRSHYKVFIAVATLFASAPAFAQHENRLPEISLVGSNATINCTSAPVMIGVSIKNWVPGFTYSWNTGQTDSVINVKPDKTTTYELHIIHSILGINAVRAFQIYVSNDPVEAEDKNLAIDKYTCPGKDVVLSVTAEGGYTPYEYKWSNGSTNPNPVVRPLQNETYQVTVTDRCGSVVEANVSVEFAPHDPIVVPNPTTIYYECEGDRVKIWPKLTGVKGGVGYGYVYSFSDWSNANQAIHVDPLQGSTYTAVVTDACRKDVATTTIFLEKTEPAVPSLEDIHTCTGQTVELIDSPEQHLFYWDGHEMHPSYSAVIDDSRSFKLIYIDACGDQHSLSRNVVVDDLNSDFDYDVHATANSVELYPLINEPTSVYRWIVNGETVGSLAHESVELAEGSSNEITLEVLNKNGCFSSTTRTVLVRDNMSVPSAFSPNGDGFNDFFTLQMDEEFMQFNIKIFDRWGQLVYETNDQYFAWDGGEMKNSQILNTYVYRMKGKTLHGKTIDKIGTLTIIN